MSRFIMWGRCYLKTIIYLFILLVIFLLINLQILLMTELDRLYIRILADSECLNTI